MSYQMKLGCRLLIDVTSGVVSVTCYSMVWSGVLGYGWVSERKGRVLSSRVGCGRLYYGRVILHRNSTVAHRVMNVTSEHYGDP